MQGRGGERGLRVSPLCVGASIACRTALANCAPAASAASTPAPPAVVVVVLYSRVEFTQQ